jgi:hypothetical protein
MKKPIRIGNIEILPRDKEYPSYKSFLGEYSPDDHFHINTKQVNSGGIRICNYLESSYLLKEFKKLGIGKNLIDYYYTFVTSVELIIDPSGGGNYKSVLIDDPEEIVKYEEREDSIGTDNDGEDIEIYPYTRIADETKEETIFFLCREI